MREHVLPNGLVHSRTPASSPRASTVRGAGLRPWTRRGSGAVHLTIQAWCYNQLHASLLEPAEKCRSGVQPILDATSHNEIMISSSVLLLVSIAAGLVGAMSGMGGATVLVPLLTFFGIDIKQAIALGVLSAILTSSSAAAGYVRRHMPNFRVGAFLEVFGVLGALSGAVLTLVSGRRLLFFLAGGVFLVSSVILWWQRPEHRTLSLQQDTLARWLSLKGSYYDYAEQRTITYQGGHAALGGLFMFCAGIISGLLGISGSAFVVLINDAVMGLPPKVSLTTSHLIIGVMALVSAQVYLEAGLFNFHLVIPMVLGVPLGVLLGSTLIVNITNRIVQLILHGMLFIFGIRMLLLGLRGT